MPGFGRINSLHLMVGGFQAVLAYGLYEAADQGVWPASHAAAFIPLFMLMLFFPFAFYCANTAVTVRRWLISFAVAFLAAAVGLYQGLTVSGVTATSDVLEPDWSPERLGDFLLPALILGLALFLLVPALSLCQRGLRIDYRQWMRALQQNAQLLLQAGMMLGLFWVVLFTAAALFRLINLNFMRELIELSWFSIPLSVLVFSHGVSLAVRNHNVVDYLSERMAQLCGWLYPMAAVLGVGFVLSWLVQGLDTLLATGHAANLLLWFTALSLLLLNMATRGGVQPDSHGRWLQWLAALGMLALLPMTLVAAYALSLRIGQYGLTPLRIWAGFVNLVLVLLVAGYLLHWLRRLLRETRGSAGNGWMARSNAVVAVVVVLGILLMLGGPLDPRRISVASQMARLQHSVAADVTPVDTAPDDAAALVRFLSRDGGRFGTEALLHLAKQQGEEGSAVSLRAELARQALERPQLSTASAAEVLNNLPVFPAGASLPPGLLEELAKHTELARCSAELTAADACLIWQVRLNTDAPEQYTLLARQNTGRYPAGILWRQPDSGQWEQSGSIDLNDSECPMENPGWLLFEAIIQGQVEMQAKKQLDLRVNGMRIRTSAWRQEGCY